LKGSRGKGAGKRTNGSEVLQRRLRPVVEKGRGGAQDRRGDPVAGKVPRGAAEDSQDVGP